MSGLASGLDTETIIKELMSAEQLKVDKVDKKKMALEMKSEIWKDLNSKIYSFYTKQVSAFKSISTYRAKTAAVSDSTVLSAKASTSAIAGTHSFQVNQLAQAAHLYSNKISDASVKTSAAMTFTLNDGESTSEITLSAGASIEDLMDEINDSGLNINATYDEDNARILLDNTKQGSASTVQLTGLDATEAAYFESLGFYANSSGQVKASEATFYKNSSGTIIDKDAYDELDATAKSAYSSYSLGTDGKNAKYTYNGMELENSSNSVSMNGIKLTLQAVSSQAVTVTVANDTSGIYDKIKSFVTSYNELLAEMNEYIYADDNEYEPLTDTEKESLDDTTIEKWESKVKEKLLRRDDTLMELTRNMRSIATASSGVDTSGLDSAYRYLSDVGIVTGDYAEFGVLHIQGDADDDSYSSYTNKLEAALEEDPEAVAKMFSAIGNQMSSMMRDKMTSSTLRSALTFYNDKEMTAQISDYEDAIDDLEERMTDLEDRYYTKFTAMETAIAKYNSMSSYLSGLFATS